MVEETEGWGGVRREEKRREEKRRRKGRQERREKKREEKRREEKREEKRKEERRDEGMMGVKVPMRATRPMRSRRRSNTITGTGFCVA